MKLLRMNLIPNIHDLNVYREHGGYQALTKACRMNPSEIIDVIDQSGLRGRGGAAYPTGKKMRAVALQSEQQRFFVCNVAEGEPGSFKDHALLKNPHQVLESSAIAAYAIGAQQAFVYLRGSFVQEEKLLNIALTQAEQAGILPMKIVIHRGENSYIAGEETALLESLEGKPAIPRTKPPRPYESGLWEKPTLVSNIETICNTINIVLYGPDEFRKLGTPDSPGTKIFCLSGQIRNPGLYELPLGTLLSELLYVHGGGPLEGRKLVGIFPGGPSTPFLSAERDIPLDFESVQKAGSNLGTGGIIVIDDSTTMLDLAESISSFFMRESCKTCPPCTIGTQETHALIHQMAEAKTPIAANIAKINELCEMMKFRGNCAHNRSAAFSISSLLKQL
jgi:NADH-quinone oxidoreductase subunit F